ncbi:SpoIIE family protein phosphatase [Streptomyces sp. NRRL F-2580]|uniref:SpoIIE family protein phosphatase n=1 Tax=Streptomyces sp. NRRL F-2580 TaxID=1463841 RepID=UPI00099D4ED0|nr:SpoIIE family protein phosphatase [Streptomyces sp. NRRL F-2580]
MPAATITRQIRSMLRQATLDHPPYSAATALTALDAACSVLPIDAGSTLVHAPLDLADGRPGWTLTWSNAGHPPLRLVGRRREGGLLGHRGEVCSSHSGAVLLRPGPQFHVAPAVGSRSKTGTSSSRART